MLSVKKSMQIIAYFSLCIFQGYGEDRTNISKINEVQSHKSQTIQEKEDNDSLDAYEKLHWETDMDHAFERAKKENKHVITMVEEPRCKWCKKMKAAALSDPRVQQKLHSYILLKVQRSNKETTKRISYFTEAIPSFYFMEPDQEVYDVIVGYTCTENFLKYLTEIEEEN